MGQNFGRGPELAVQVATTRFELVTKGLSIRAISVGQYGYLFRSWYTFHRQTLPGGFIPQFIRAALTPELDARFAKLAAWLKADGQPDTACSILGQVYLEAPLSESGRLWQAGCY